MATTKTKAKKQTTAAAPPAKLKALRGTADEGQAIDFSAQSMSMAPALPEAKEPRPSPTRYPIPDATFKQLKERAYTLKAAKGKIQEALDAAPTVEAPAGMVPQAFAAAPPAPALSPGTSFAGIADTGWIPPDCTMAVGPDHVVLAVNSTIAVYRKKGGKAVIQRTLTQWFANRIQGFTIFDPKALYDQHEGRWVLLAVAFRTNPNQSVFLLSVSATADPTGTWRNYVLDAQVDGKTKTNNWADYPSLGVDAQALYVTANMFLFGGNFQYAKVRVIPKAGPYSGGPVPFADFVRPKNADGTLAFAIQPCHTFGAPQVEYMVNSFFPKGNAITVWQLTNPLNPSPTLTRSQIAVTPYTLPPNADQQGGPEPLNTGDIRIQRAVFRGDSIWTAVTTNRDWGAGNRASIQWMQLRPASPALVQEGVFGTKDSHYFYPAISPDTNGNMVLVFSRSGANEFGSIAYTGRRSTDPLGTLQGSSLLKAGVAHYQRMDDNGRNRWGDYNGSAVDPNGKLIWFYAEFAAATNVWATQVGSAFF